MKTRGRRPFYSQGTVKCNMTLQRSTVEALTTLAGIMSQTSGKPPSISLAVDRLASVALEKINKETK